MYQSEHTSALSRHAPDPADDDDTNAPRTFPSRNALRLSLLIPSEIFFHPDYTVGLGVSPGHALRLVGYTTGRDFHPALKILYKIKLL